MTTDFDFLRDEDGYFPEDIADLIINPDPVRRAHLVKVGRMVIKHKQYKRSWKWLENTLHESGTGREAVAGLFCGVSGVGKSTILRQFTTKYGGPFPTRTTIVRPVIRISTPANPKLENIWKTMLVALSSPDLICSDAEAMRLSIQTQLHKQSVKMIIFDEFTHVVEDRTENFTKRAVRGLKDLLSENHCQLIFAGTLELAGLDGLYDQVRRRNSGTVELRPIDWVEDNKDWMTTLEYIQTELPLKCEPGLPNVEMARKMHLASNGILDHVMKLLFRATAYAYDGDKEVITATTLADAFEHLRRGSKQANPFGKPSLPSLKPPKPGPKNEVTEVTGLSRRARQDTDTFSK